MRGAVGALLFSLCIMWAQQPINAPAVDAPKNDTDKTDTQTLPVLRNYGEPMILPFQCTDDDIQWAGMSCSEEEPCPLYIEVTGIETVGNRIVLPANIHSESTTLYSVLLSSDDAGVTWREAHERMRGSGLDHIQFVDFQNGWVSGETLVPVARDPFFLITSDGGKTWRMRPIFNEGGGGAIQQFWFDTPATGSLVIDRMASTESSRYELYESPNGGETWIIRRTSEHPISLRKTASLRTDIGWRVRADARSKAFAIERKEGEHWNKAASFLVKIGSCKPVPHVTPASVDTEEQAPKTPASVLPGQRKAPSLQNPK
jgi:hypothetical protein